MKSEERDITINIITLGACGVGKTSIINRIKDGTFRDHYKATVGLDYFVMTRKYEKKNIIMLLQFNDTTGLEQFQNIIPIQYIRDSHIVLLVFSNVETLNDIRKRWYIFYKKNSNTENSRFILIGNKSDIFGDEKAEILKQGQEFADEIVAHFITCSAKSADNMDNVENYIISEAKRFIDENVKIKTNDNKKMKLVYDSEYILNDPKNQEQKRKCC